MFRWFHGTATYLVPIKILILPCIFHGTPLKELLLEERIHCLYLSIDFSQLIHRQEESRGYEDGNSFQNPRYVKCRYIRLLLQDIWNRL